MNYLDILFGVLFNAASGLNFIMAYGGMGEMDKRDRDVRQRIYGREIKRGGRFLKALAHAHTQTHKKP